MKKTRGSNPETDPIQQSLNVASRRITIHIVPVIPGSGISLLNKLDNKKDSLEIVEVIQSELVTHLRYKVLRK